MKKNSPQFIEALKALKKLLASFVIQYKTIDVPKEKKQYLVQAQKYAAILKSINPILKKEQLRTSNCLPEDIPASVRKHDKAEGIQILNSNISIIQKYKEDYEQYLLNCFGIQLNWKDGLPSPNVGTKYDFNYGGNGKRLVIYTKEIERAPNIGQAQLSSKLRQYRALESRIRTTLVEENANSSLTEEIDLERLNQLEEFLKEHSGGLHDLYHNIIRDPALKQQYQKIVERIQSDWAENGRMTLLKKKVEKRLQQTIERRQDSPCPNEEPEAKKEQEPFLEQKDFSALPLFHQGIDDTSAIDINDIDQGATGDCYYLSSVAALAKMHPQLFTGEKAMIQKKGDYYEVTLHLREDRSSTQRTPTVIKVSPKVLVDKDGKPKYQGLGDQELWAIILEKAYAQALGGYDNIESGSPREALEVLTGRTSISLDPNTLSNKDLLEKIKASIDCQYPTTISSIGTGEKEVEISFQGKTQKLFQGHAYTLEKVEDNTIFLYNPHGSNHLQLDVKLLKKHFHQIQLLQL
ncbi:C2 family cysteine protease [Aureispira anguillae]|uniref:C2 family cysteine protease n=1 Tax=Aureispira anguillae TaxID=2864201 RepID=A0A915YG94_9BACT|nr:C2 family cysteine protease [Aureispira anguillae]BDS12599.1 C2 family cysteine protease [Aureispira anguillae]